MKNEQREITLHAEKEHRFQCLDLPLRLLSTGWQLQTQNI